MIKFNGQNQVPSLLQVVFLTEGSMLGPLLFTIFVNDIPSVMLNPTFMFADDTKIIHFVRSM